MNPDGTFSLTPDQTVNYLIAFHAMAVGIGIIVHRVINLYREG
jgi:hypothetical protein